VNPRQEVLLPLDAYRLLFELLGDKGGVIIDGGANVGDSVDALRRWFPRSTVHAFEPVSAAFAKLEERARALGPGVLAHRLALGERAGTARMHVNRNLWTCSMLPANAEGLRYHGDWCETVGTEEVEVVRLDAWLDEHGLTVPRIVKLDLQGVETPALRGATGILADVEAVYAEAQLIPEYDGASLFADTDACLRDHGFGLYQIADLCLKGEHAEPSSCDALWLRRDVLDRVRRSCPPLALRERGFERSARMDEALTRCRDAGLRRVAIYGAGAHTLACAGALATAPVEIVAVIDDAPSRHGALWGFPVVSRDEAAGLDLDAVVISSDRAEAAILAAAAPLRRVGITLLTLYAGDGVEMHSGERCVEA
jgi:FkbM family methyltransferase